MGAPAVPARRSAPRPATKRKPATRRAAATRAAPARRVSRPSKRASAAAPARKRTTPKRSRSRITPPGGMAMIPVTAVGRTAGAVGGLADSGMVVGMTRSRLWIGVLGALLGGIVALNVWGLSLSASTSGTAAKIDALERDNSVLRARVARRLSTDRVQKAARGLGLGVPAPKGVRYLKSGGGDAAAAAKRLAGNEISLLAALPIAPELAQLADAAVAAPEPTAPVTPVVPPGTDPAAVAPAEPAPAAPVVPTEPEATAPPADPAATPPPAAPAGGVTTP